MNKYKFKIGNAEVLTNQLTIESANRYIIRYKRYFGMRGLIKYIGIEL